MPGYSSEAHLADLLEFCAKEEIKATFFAVPRADGVVISRQPGYAKLLREAIADGHEVGQHGLDHDRFEFGIPPPMILELPHEGPAREYLAGHRDEIDANQTIPKLRERLALGRRIIEDAIGRAVAGFRAPCLSVCDRLFRALELEGYEYDSSACLQQTAWDFINGRLETQPRPITRERIEEARSVVSIAEIPLTAEYTWYLESDPYSLFLDLARHDVEACGEAEIPFVPLCHVSPVQEGAGNRGFDLYRDLLRHARDRAAETGRRFTSTTLHNAHP